MVCTNLWQNASWSQELQSVWFKQKVRERLKLTWKHEVYDMFVDFWHACDLWMLSFFPNILFCKRTHGLKLSSPVICWWTKREQYSKSWCSMLYSRETHKSYYTLSKLNTRYNPARENRIPVHNYLFVHCKYGGIQTFFAHQRPLPPG